jgi:probable phosphoglycerate mutase
VRARTGRWIGCGRHIFRVIAARWIELPASGGARLALKAGAVCALGYERDTQVITLWNETPP